MLSITLPELMALTGLTPGEAEERITAYCAAFGGSPEATEDGTVVYRFDELLLRADKQNRSFPDLSGPIKRLKAFSSNPKKMNGWFSVINGANLLFGGYFLVNALSTGAVNPDVPVQASSFLYAVTYQLFSVFFNINPLPAIIIGLGWVPIIFSALFWLIPALRYVGTKKDNEEIKRENFRKSGYGQIWRAPLRVNPREMAPQAAECRPKNLAAAQNGLITEVGAYTVPEVAVDETGATVYTFAELDREKGALEKYRSGVDTAASELGKIVFDSDGRISSL
jgi:hypothetical protein